ncbi:CSMD3-like protein [Mya arenaria]|uniref:CSMD3-like protein n=1 Tax=Mya arenaria TaxID=6604 RepID=A0ABY7DF00_MYAAR|nr:CSMD3-like protein [Mya arenaria]
MATYKHLTSNYNQSFISYSKYFSELEKPHEADRNHSNTDMDLSLSVRSDGTRREPSSFSENCHECSKPHFYPLHHPPPLSLPQHPSLAYQPLFLCIFSFNQSIVIFCMGNITITDSNNNNHSSSPVSGPYVEGDTVTYTCSTGYAKTAGDLVHTCTSGAWTGTLPTCSILTCVPASVPNSSKSPDQATYDYATSVTYSCTTGYEHTGGDLTRTCQADTTWSGTTPACSRMHF